MPGSLRYHHDIAGESGMAQRIYYDIDGRISGPVSFMQLQLLASSGMLLPHHKVRKEKQEAWLPARQVRGLFGPGEGSESLVTPLPSARPIDGSPPAAPPTDFGFGTWSDMAPAEEEPPANSAFDFFADQAAESPERESRSEADAGAAPANPAAPIAPPPRPPDSKSAPSKTSDSKPETKLDDPAADASVLEVVGQAVEMLENDSARLLDGKTAFRLIRGWIQALSKFTDGTSRTVYLRLSSINAAVLELRPAARRAKGGPYPVLSFVAGNAQIALAIQGSDKPHRAFLERLVAAVGAGKSANAK